MIHYDMIIWRNIFRFREKCWLHWFFFSFSSSNTLSSYQSNNKYDFPVLWWHCEKRKNCKVPAGVSPQLFGADDFEQESLVSWLNKSIELLLASFLGFLFLFATWSLSMPSALFCLWSVLLWTLKSCVWTVGFFQLWEKFKDDNIKQNITQLFVELGLL